MFLSGTLNLQIYSDSAQTVYPQLSQPNLNVTFTNSAVTGKEELYFSLAASASQTINFNSLSGVTQWYINSDAANLSLQINGASAMTYTFGIPGYIPLTLTSLIVTNASSSVATNVHLILIKG